MYNCPNWSPLGLGISYRLALLNHKLFQPHLIPSTPILCSLRGAHRLNATASRQSSGVLECTQLAQDGEASYSDSDHKLLRGLKRNVADFAMEGTDAESIEKGRTNGKGAAGGSRVKLKLTPEHREKLSMAAAGRQFSPEHREKLREAAKGRKLSAEHRQKISKAATGRVRSSETRLKMSASKRRGGEGGRAKPSQPVEGSVEKKSKKKKDVTTSIIKEEAKSQARKVSPIIQQLERALQRQLRIAVIPEELLMEKAVIEIVNIRKEILRWQSQYRERYGQKPSLEDTKTSGPHIYQLVVKFAALQAFVRDAESPGEDKEVFRRTKTSSFRGVSWHKAREKWSARIWDKERKKNYHLGLFATEKEADQAYQDAQQKLAAGLEL